uniref:Putative secreted protein n=1 Tax=Ixodes ricinus TaxID=34613 RepID=A0A6B0UJU3_IXORI
MAKIINSLILVTAIITLQGVISTSSKINTYESIEYDGDDSEESTAPLTKTEATTITPPETIPAPSPNKTATNEEPENKLGGAGNALRSNLIISRSTSFPFQTYFMQRSCAK